jgi:hypothetical protein
MNDALLTWAAPLRGRVDDWMLDRFADAWPPRFQEA